jgi:hypothetical protein
MSYEFNDHFIDQNARWEWTYHPEAGYNNCPVDIDGLGNTVLEVGTSSSCTSTGYSDGNLRETALTHSDINYVEWKLKSSGITQGTHGFGIWNGSSTGVSAIWFWWASTESYVGYQGFRAQVVTAGAPLHNESIVGVDESTWHTYRIQRHSTYVQFMIDGISVSTYLGSGSTTLLRCELWTDNAYYSSLGSASVTAITHAQKIYSDYCNYGTLILPKIHHMRSQGIL